MKTRHEWPGDHVAVPEVVRGDWIHHADADPVPYQAAYTRDIGLGLAGDTYTLSGDQT